MTRRGAAGARGSPPVRENGGMSEPGGIATVGLPGDARMPMVGLGTWKVSGWN